MSFSDNIEYLMAHQGTVAAFSLTIHGTRFAGISAWRDVLSHALAMAAASKEATISATIGEHSILAESRDGQQCAVVYPTGHPVAKVMRRMLRKAAGPKRAASRVIADKPSAAA